MDIEEEILLIGLQIAIQEYFRSPDEENFEYYKSSLTNCFDYILTKTKKELYGTNTTET